MRRGLGWTCIGAPLVGAVFALRHGREWGRLEQLDAAAVAAVFLIVPALVAVTLWLALTSRASGSRASKDGLRRWGVEAFPVSAAAVFLALSPDGNLAVTPLVASLLAALGVCRQNIAPRERGVSMQRSLCVASNAPGHGCAAQTAGSTLRFFTLLSYFSLEQPG